MRFTLIVGVALCVALAQGAPVSEEKGKDEPISSQTTLAPPVTESKEEVTEVPEDEVTTTESTDDIKVPNRVKLVEFELQRKKRWREKSAWEVHTGKTLDCYKCKQGSKSGEDRRVEHQTNSDSSVRDGRALNEEEDDDEADREEEQDEDDEDEDEDEEEEEEEERKLAAAKAGRKPSLKKKGAVGKPVPILGEGVEDDEAEDLGIFEREEPKSDEKGSEEKSEEEPKEEDDEDESGEDEERDEPIGSGGLVAEPVSSERGDVDESVMPIAAQNEIGEPQQPLAIALVQPEETSDPVVPILVEESLAESSKAEKDGNTPARKNIVKKEDEEEDDEDEEEEEEEEEEARSDKVTSKVNRARSAYPSPVLYYYPFPESPVKADGVY